MTITRVDTKLTTDTAGVLSRAVTKPTLTNLAPGDYLVMCIAGNLSPSPTISAQPPGFTQIGSRQTAGGGPSLHLDLFYRELETQGEIDGIAAEDWTLTMSGTDKCQVPVLAYRGLWPGGFPFINQGGWTELDTVGNRHYGIGDLAPLYTGCKGLMFFSDRLTSPPSYTQVDSSDTVVFNDPGQTTNAVTMLVLESPVLRPATIYRRNLALSVPSAIAAAKFITLLDANGTNPGIARPARFKRWTGSAWEPNVDVRRWSGSAWTNYPIRRFT